jgi:hypothetical protein
MTAQQVGALRGEPGEIVTAKGLDDFKIWKYYLWQDCQAHLGLRAPTTALFFLDGNLSKGTSFVVNSMSRSNGTLPWRPEFFSLPPAGFLLLF